MAHGSEQRWWPSALSDETGRAPTNGIKRCDFADCAGKNQGARQRASACPMMTFCAREAVMTAVHFRRAACLLAACLALTSLAACRDRHEPVKPTVTPASLP